MSRDRQAELTKGERLLAKLGTAMIVITIHALMVWQTGCLLMLSILITATFAGTIGLIDPGNLRWVAWAFGSVCLCVILLCLMAVKRALLDHGFWPFQPDLGSVLDKIFRDEVATKKQPPDL
jgi:hypothetical protein